MSGWLPRNESAPSKSRCSRQPNDVTRPPLPPCPRKSKRKRLKPAACSPLAISSRSARLAPSPWHRISQGRSALAGIFHPSSVMPSVAWKRTVSNGRESTSGETVTGRRGRKVLRRKSAAAKTHAQKTARKTTSSAITARRLLLDGAASTNRPFRAHQDNRRSIRGGQDHPLALDASQLGGLQIGDDNHGFSHELRGLIGSLDAGHQLPRRAVTQINRQHQQLVGIRMIRSCGDDADTQRQTAELLDGYLGRRTGCRWRGGRRALPFLAHGAGDRLRTGAS